MSSSENQTRPFIVSTDIKMIDNSCNEQQTCLTIDTDDTLSSSTINSTKTASSSSIEQTLPTTKLTTIAHRFISKKIFKPETCFVVKKKEEFFINDKKKHLYIMFSVSNESILVLYHIVVHIVLNHVMLIVKKMQVQIVKHCQLMQCYHLFHLKHQQFQHSKIIIDNEWLVQNLEKHQYHQHIHQLFNDVYHSNA